MATLHTLDTGRVIPAGRKTRPLDLENALAEIEKGQQLAGHFPNAEAMDRARRILVGETSREDAMEELRRKYSQA